MPGGTVTKYEDLVQISNYKLGMSDAYVTGAAPQSLEKAMVQSLFGEADTAKSIELFNDATHLDVANLPQTHSYTTISPNDAQVIQHGKYRNVAVLGEYKTNVDAGNSTFAGVVKISNTYNVSKTSIVVDDSTAYEHASVKFTVTDPYATNEPFSTTDNVADPERFVALFDTTTASGEKNWLITRNVNATHANSSRTGLMTVAEDKAWNTQSTEFGASFINGEVSAAADGKLSVSTAYATTDTKNILHYTGFQATYHDGGEPVTGRYALSYANSGSAADRVEVITNAMTNLVVVADKTQYETFEGAPSIYDTLAGAQLPSSLAATTAALGPYLPPVNNGIASGFVFDIKGPLNSADTDGEILINNLGTVADMSTYIPAPMSIDIGQMDFSIAHKYYLEKSVDTDGHTLKASYTEGSSAIVNSLVITNGHLAITTPTAEIPNFSILDGKELLTDTTVNSNGAIDVFTSPDKADYDVAAINYRVTAAPLTATRTAAVFKNVVVNYNAGETNYLPEVGILGSDDKTTTLLYSAETLVTQTATTNGYVSSNRIANQAGAVAFVKTANSAIAASGITFASNSNTYNDEELQVIDLVCQKKWQEGKAYTMNSDGTNKTEISGVAINITASNVVNDENVKDLRVKLTAKSLSDLSFKDAVASEGWAVTVNDSSAFLKTSLLKQGVLDDSAIIDILTASEPTPALTLSFGPAVSTVNANKYTKFHNQLTIAYGEAEQITYDDEFTISNYTVSSETVEDVTAAHANVPANMKLTQRSFTESFKVTTPFRFGNYSNISITTPTISQTTTYYALTDNINADKVVPRSYLAPIRTVDGGAVPQATITADLRTLTVDFTQADLKPFKSQLQGQVGTDAAWNDVASGACDVDLWYNTDSTLPSTMGDFTYAFSFSPNVLGMTSADFYIDMSLEKGVASFGIVGRKFTQAQVDVLGAFNIATYDIENTSAGTAIADLEATYIPNDSSLGVSGTTTLSGGGYTFTYTNNIYVSIRIVACPQGMFKVIRTAASVVGSPVYKTITTANSAGALKILKLAEGVYTYGELLSTIPGHKCTWTFLNDSIKVTFYTGYTVRASTSMFAPLLPPVFARITSLHQQFRISNDPLMKGVTNNILRGFTPGASITIARTPTRYRLKIAGYDSGYNVFAPGVQAVLAGMGSLILNASNAIGVNSMYPDSFGASRTFPLSINYPSYTITDQASEGATIFTTIVPSYKTVISDRYGVKIISKSLNTGVSAQYRIEFTSTRTLNVYRLTDYLSHSTTLSNFTGSSPVHAFTLASLKDTAENRTRNLIGNVIDIRFVSTDNVPDLTCYFTIAPPSLKFTANRFISDGTFFPFVSSMANSESYYRDVNTQLPNQTVRPFSTATSINNVMVNFSPKSYVAYKSATTVNTKVFNILPNKVKVEYATGLAPAAGDYFTVYNDYIPTDAYTEEDNSIKFVSSLVTHSSISANCDDSVTISLSQGVISQATTPVIFPSGTDFNLQFKLASHFLPNGTTYTAKFNAGDCTNLTSYCIDSMALSASILSVTVAKYYYTSDGISADFFKDNITNGLIISGTQKRTATFTADFTATTSRIKISDLLTIARGTVPNTIGWSANAATSDVLLWVKPTQKIITVQKTLRAPFLLSQSIPKTVLLFQCQDALRVHDSNEVPVHRINSNGVQIANSVSSYVGSNLLTIANAHKL